ncbi:MAG: hypothetical protein COB20_09805 [SAR86 cluster bacterium]|uniref:DUF1415 domain-containing protein n=1 Tax=SAR86 cluster bacterium TaxID=2030880 RepID=A0A2A4X2B7_9GAMM|nr:MAG: hypothetical protein COB20_09805 [SAR86 cluster bacterium]
MHQHEIVKDVRHWLEAFVIELNLCPFAKRELINDRVKFVVSDASTEEHLLADLQQELSHLQEDGEIETTLLIHPNVLQAFDDYNQFLNIVDALLDEEGLLGVYQIASFHPQYRFSDTEEDDAENYSNRSPYPILHLLRESSLEREIARHQDTSLIPQRNIQLLRTMGTAKLQALLQRTDKAPATK